MARQHPDPEQEQLRQQISRLVSESYGTTPRDRFEEIIAVQGDDDDAMIMATTRWGIYFQSMRKGDPACSYSAAVSPERSAAFLIRCLESLARFQPFPDEREYGHQLLPSLPDRLRLLADGFDQWARDHKEGSGPDVEARYVPDWHTGTPTDQALSLHPEDLD